jgi:YD repeat-containing protein
MGIVTTYEYDEAGYRIAKNEAVGTSVARRTEFTFNSDGRAMTRTIKGESLAQDSTTTYDYDLSGHLVGVSDPEGRTTRLLDYDTAGNPRTIEDGLGHQKHFEYDAGGNVRFVRDHNNKLLAEYRYDEGNNRSSVLNAYLQEYQLVYDSRKNLGSESSRNYNVADKPVEATDEENQPVYYEYDLFERLQKTIDGEGNEVGYEHAAADGCGTCSGKRGRVFALLLLNEEFTVAA